MSSGQPIERPVDGPISGGHASGWLAPTVLATWWYDGKSELLPCPDACLGAAGRVDLMFEHAAEAVEPSEAIRRGAVEDGASNRGGRGDTAAMLGEHPADRLDPEPITMSVDVVDDHRCGRSELVKFPVDRHGGGLVRQCAGRDDKRALQDRVRPRARRTASVERRRRARAGDPVVGALVQRATPPRPLRRRPAGRVRSSVLRCPTTRPRRGWKPMERASTDPGRFTTVPGAGQRTLAGRPHRLVEAAHRPPEGCATPCGVPPAKTPGNHVTVRAQSTRRSTGANDPITRPRPERHRHPPPVRLTGTVTHRRQPLAGVAVAPAARLRGVPCAVLDGAPIAERRVAHLERDRLLTQICGEVGPADQRLETLQRIEPIQPGNRRRHHHGGGHLSSPHT